MKTSDLSGPALEYWFMKATGKFDAEFSGVSFADWMEYGGMPEMCGWDEIGPIIERESIHLAKRDGWWGTIYSENNIEYVMRGPTPLIAIKRCIVASKFGNEV